MPSGGSGMTFWGVQQRADGGRVMLKFMLSVIATTTCPTPKTPMGAAAQQAPLPHPFSQPPPPLSYSRIAPLRPLCVGQSHYLLIDCRGMQCIMPGAGISGSPPENFPSQPLPPSVGPLFVCLGAAMDSGLWTVDCLLINSAKPAGC